MTTSVIYQVPLKELGLLQIAGPQSAEFLQGQLSCDVTEITPHQSRLGVHCNAKGRVLATFRLFYKSPNYYLLLPQTIVSPLFEDLRKYALFYKVTLQDVSQSFQKIGMMSVTLEKDLASWIADFKLEKDRVYTHQTTTLLMVSGIMPRVVVLSESAIVLENITTQYKPFSAWETIDIDSGIATVTPKTRGLFTPHHLNYHRQGGISFTKGCYTGQEVIARMQYRGNLKQQLYKFALNSDTPPLPGSDILDKTGKPQGMLVMAARQSEESEQSAYKALAVMQNTVPLEMLYLGNIPIQQIEGSVESDES